MTRLIEAQLKKVGYLPEPKQQPAAIKLKESDIQRQIKEFLQWHGWFVFKNHQSLGSYKGIADLYAIKDSRSIWIEVKTPDGSQSKDQRKFEEDIKAHGGEYIVVRCVEDVMKLAGGVVK
ncbi:MAG TPA: VRR-NUC domain-containing protein [Bacillota bacterium]|nr:VRR-NUC domain-containing protein [Bacillota bacterium]